MASESVNEDIDSKSENGEDSPSETINVSECESKEELHDDGDSEVPFLHSYEEMVPECAAVSFKVTIEKKCDICSEKRQAESFCRICQDALCIVCTEEHKIIRSTRDHTIVDIAELMTDTNKMCGICSESSKNVEAVSYCEDCPEYLCSDCTEKHKVLKPTRKHAVVNLDMKCPDKYPCEICTELGKDDVDASSYCQECDQNLCEDCVEQHKRIKSTRNHLVIPISEKVSNNKNEECRNEDSERIKQARERIPAPDTRMKEEKHLTDNTKREKTYGSLDTMEMMPDNSSNLLDNFCEPCSGQGKSMQGASACKQCKEILCHNCTTYHLSQKIFRDHKCVEITKLLRQVVWCEPCSTQDKYLPALFHCTECFERLCKSCKIHHTSNKMLKDHKLVPILEHLLETYEDEIDCGPCKYQGISSIAVGYCTDCEDADPLCNRCIQQHNAQKMTRSHKISTEISKLKSGRESTDPAFTNDEILECGPCKYQGISSIAVGYCTDCEDADPLCNTCIRQHEAQKMTRSHKISTEISKSKSEKESKDQGFTSDKMTNRKKDHGDITRQSIKKKEQNETCSKPKETKIKPDSIGLVWEHPENNRKSCVDQYQIRYRVKNGGKDEKWKSVYSESNRNNTIITGLRSDTTYEFQVRPVYDDTEGPYSIVSDPVKTPPSLASKMLAFSTKMQDSDSNKVALYRLNTSELKNTRNPTAKTRKVLLGEDDRQNTKEKTIMLIGATGSGKSTMVDGLVNYLMGVSFDDPFRFKLVTLEEEEQKQSNQALSQTEWITSYTIHPLKDGRHDFKINIIDTPGFGDTRGIQRDTDIIKQIKELFSAGGYKGVTFIDAVCFLVKAPDARLTVTQKYIFHSIMSLFGNDISKNICTLITFADGDKPPVLSSLEESGLPFGKWFPFNNSGLFVQNENLPPNSLSPIFWDMGHKSFKSLFEHIETFETKSLNLTKEVLEQREYLQSVIDNLEPQVNAGLHKLNEIRNEIVILQKHKTDIECNKDFEYTVEETRQIKIELGPGHYVTNCLKCNQTCHRICGISDDDEKSHCAVMDRKGRCSVCPNKCHWSEHKNAKYIIEYKPEKVTKKYQEKLQKYEEATGKKLTHENLIIQLADELTCQFLEIENMMAEVNECKQTLKKIALVPDPMSMPEHIDLMIQTEEMEKRPGFDVRIEMLKGMRKKAVIHQGVDDFKGDLKNIKAEMAKEISDASKLADNSGPSRVMRWLSKTFNIKL